MDHDIFEHLRTSHIIRWGEGSVDFFLEGGGFRRNGGGWVVANIISMGGL